MVGFLKLSVFFVSLTVLSNCSLTEKKHHSVNSEGTTIKFKSSSFTDPDGNLIHYGTVHYGTYISKKTLDEVRSQKDLPIALVVSAPSGCGKDTAVNKLIERNPDLVKIVSVTTRKIRSNEKDGFDYHFVSKEEFDKLSKEGKLLQEAVVYGDGRGTLKSDFEEAIKNGKNVVFNVDPKGLHDLKSALKGKARVIGVFILPPSKDELRNRLAARGTEKKEVIEYRMGLINDAMKGFENYDYKIIGDKKEETVMEIEAIYKAVKAKAKDNQMNEHGKKVMESK